MEGCVFLPLPCPSLPSTLALSQHGAGSVWGVGAGGAYRVLSRAELEKGRALVVRAECHVLSERTTRGPPGQPEDLCQ